MKKFFQIFLIVLASVSVLFSAFVLYLMICAFTTPLVLLVSVAYYVISFGFALVLLIPELILCRDKLFRIGLFINLGAILLNLASTVILIIL